MAEPIAIEDRVLQAQALHKELSHVRFSDYLQNAFST